MERAFRRWVIQGVLSFIILNASSPGQVIEFESGGLKYLTQTKNGMTIMFAPLPIQVRDFAVIQVAISNGSGVSWNVKPEDFRYVPAQGSEIAASPAGQVVQHFMKHGGQTDVIKLVTSYENGLYGMVRVKSTNGYEARREAAMASLTNARFKAAAAASAIVLAPTRLKAGESTDGAVFFPNNNKPLGKGRLLIQAAASVFEYPTYPANDNSSGGH